MYLILGAVIFGRRTKTAHNWVFFKNSQAVWFIIFLIGNENISYGDMCRKSVLPNLSAVTLAFHSTSLINNTINRNTGYKPILFVPNEMSPLRHFKCSSASDVLMSSAKSNQSPIYGLGNNWSINFCRKDFQVLTSQVC